MISSEVQRTLVKSPPELWAELSNPESLARHLGELGEVAITRSEPEKLVEWEAAGMTGTVAIKPSGWGTRVTLTVERELPEASVETEAEADAVDEADPAAEKTSTEVEAEAQSDVEAEADASPAGEAEDVPAAEETERAAEPESPPPSTDEIRPEEPRPAPATEAARRAAGWPGPDATGPAIESALRAAEDGAHEVEPLPAAWPSAPSEAEETEPAAVAPTPEPRAEPEPRKGFFARLFGGRRRRAEEPVQTETPPAPAGASEPKSPPAPSETAAPEPRPDYLPASPEEALPVTVVAEHEPPVAEAEASEVVEAAAPPGEDPPAAELEAEAAEEPAPTVEAAAEAEEEPTAERPSAKDIAAELKAAEESAAAEVTAILTGVLDRLGAAHHRPFSRA